MTEKEACTKLRREFSTSGWILLLYYAIMSASVVLVMGIEIVAKVGFQLLESGYAEMDIQGVLTDAVSGGWGYILSIGIGAALLYRWKKREFCLHTIWHKNNKMTLSAFLAVFALFFGMQAVAQVFTYALEMLLGVFGLSLQDYTQDSVLSGNSVSAFLYGSLLAPVSEEILFRGLLLYSLKPYGKKFSILCSAFLFGVFHGNIIQTPYAFLVGLILGYVTVEYSIHWAIILHVLNNMVLADFMTRISQILPPGVGDLITLIFIWGCAVAAVAVLIIERKSVVSYIKEKKIHPLCIKSFFTAPGVLTFTAILVGDIILTTIMLLLPI